MYETSTELIRNELTPDTVRPICDIFRSASVIYNEMIRSSIFETELKSNINGLLLNFIIQRHFEPRYLSSEFPFTAIVRKRGKYKLIELQKDKIWLTINKSGKSILPRHAKYKEDYASWNFGLNSRYQLKFDYISRGDVQPGIITEQYYGIITYNLKGTDFEFLDIILPDSKFRSILDTVELMPRMRLINEAGMYADRDDEEILSEQNIKKGIKEEIIDDVLTS